MNVNSQGLISAKHAYGAMVLLSIASASVGSLATYFISKKRFDESYEVRLAKELQSSIDFLVRNDIDLKKVDIGDPDLDQDLINEEPEKTIPDPPELEEEEEDTRERIFGDENKPPIDSLAANQAIEYHKMLVTETYIEKVDELEEENYEDPDISVISRDIFTENGSSFDQSSLTYFADGGVLDEAGGFVENHTDLIGSRLPPFGEMSQDPMIVYIRNKRLQREFEVIQDDQKASDFLAHELHSMYDRRT